MATDYQIFSQTKWIRKVTIRFDLDNGLYILCWEDGILASGISIQWRKDSCLIRGITVFSWDIQDLKNLLGVYNDH